MSILKITSVVLIAIITFANPKALQDNLASYTGHLVKSLVKANWVMQKLVKEEIKAAHSYVNAAVLERLKAADANADVEKVKSKMKDDFVTMLDIDKGCTAAGGVVWMANRVLRVAEKYRELYMRADVMDFCGVDTSMALNKTCASIITSYQQAVKKIENNVLSTVDRIVAIYDDTMGCLRFRYDFLLKSLASKSY